MAITTTTITKSIGWARTDVVDQLEQAFTWLGLHGGQITGLVTSISLRGGGGTVGSSNTTYYDVPVATTTGIGTGASFDIYRQYGNVYNIYVNRPGIGYTQGEYVTLSAANIGGGTAVAIGITVNIDSVGYGSTNQFFDKNFTPSSDATRPWGVLKQNFNTNKRFGVTYRGFKVYSDYQLSVYAGSSFFPFNTNNVNDGGGTYRDSFRGTAYLDVVSTDHNTNSLDSGNELYSAQVNNSQNNSFNFATSNSPTTHNLKLNIYRSAIDTNFAVLSYSQPTVSGTLNDSTFSTFIIHNFNSNLWNLDEVFSAGITFIISKPSINTNGENSATLGFRTYLTGNSQYNGANAATRTAEAGWSQANYKTVAQNYNIASSQSSYTSATGTGMGNWYTPISMPSTIYSRTGAFKDTGLLTSDGTTYGNRYPITAYTSVIKGIPINGNLIPCPYYMPDDFVLIDFKLTTSGQDIKQGDTITIGGSEVYTVITGSYNKYAETAGILFCGRTV